MVSGYSQNKLRFDGFTEKYKTILIAKDYNQKFVMDFFDTFSFVARITILGTLLVIIFIPKLMIHQLGVQTTFIMEI